MTHLMENAIYLELVRRGFSVDVGVVFSWETNKLGKRERIAREIDFVVNKGGGPHVDGAVPGDELIVDHILHCMGRIGLAEIQAGVEKSDVFPPNYQDAAIGHSRERLFDIMFA